MDCCRRSGCRSYEAEKVTTCRSDDTQKHQNTTHGEHEGAEPVSNVRTPVFIHLFGSVSAVLRLICSGMRNCYAELNKHAVGCLEEGVRKLRGEKDQHKAKAPA